MGCGYWYYQTQADAIRQSKYESLAAIAKMKAGQIVQWRKERLSDARRATRGPVLQREATEILNQTAAPAVFEELRNIITVAQEDGIYANIFLVDLEGTVLLATKDIQHPPVTPLTKQALTAALASKEPVMSSFFPDVNHVHIDTVAAVRDAGGKAIGALILRCNADDYLYPLIQSWPTPSHSAETLLVQREGDEVVFLNELRHQKKTALRLREPVSQTGLPAVQAVLGKQGKFEGKDYRGEMVLADLTAIPGTPWCMVSKVSQDEILSEARYRAASICIIVGSLVLLAGSVTAFAYKRRQIGLLQRTLAAERQEKEGQEMFRTTLYSIGDGVLTADTEGCVREMNPVAEWLTGWTEAEARGKPMHEVFVIVNQETRTIVPNPVETVLRDGVVVGLANHTLLIARDGTEHAIADSAAPIRDENGAVSGVVLVFSDVTEEYRMRDALSRREQEYRMLFEGMVEGFASHEILCDGEGKPIDYRFLSMNPAFERMTGLSAVDAVGRTVREVFPGIEPAWINRYGCVALTGEPIHFEDYTQTLDRHFAITAYRPQPNQFAVLVEDITKRKAAEARIERLSHLYAALSQCNQAIVHAANVEELFPQVCRTVVEFGGMTMVWISMADEETGAVRPVASFGSGTEYLEEIQISVKAEHFSGRGPTGTAIRENKPVWCHDFQNDPQTAPWHERAAHYGFAASASLPLHREGKPVGALTMYSDKVGVFDEEIRKLLLEMADDISFALESFARKAEHKQAEVALHESEMMLRESQRVAVMGSYILDIPAGLWRSSDTLDTVFGIDASYARTVEGWAALVHPEDREMMGEYFQCEVLGKMTFFNKEYRIVRHADQAERWVHGMGQLEYNAQGDPVKMFGTIQDITERKQAEEAMRLQSSALQAAANAIVITDKKGLIQWVNAAFTAVTGYRAAEVIGQNPRLLKSGKQDPEVYKNLWGTVLAGKVWQGEIMNRRKDGSLYTEDMTITPVKDSQGEVTHFISVKQDITQRKQIEEKLMQTERIESIGRLASGVAHDLNNILTPILLSAEMLHATEDATTRECLISSIEECAQRGANVVNQVLTFARGAKGEHVTLQLSRLVEDMEKIITETFPKNLTITSNIPCDLWPINGDSTQIHQVLLNLCINARDAMPEGGALRIAGENVEIDENFAAMVADAKVGDYAVLALSDTGTGIPQEITSKIFDPFFTTKEVGKGTGLGLSTVMGIMHSHGGFVTVESEEGRGSTFKLFLPAATDNIVKQKAQSRNMSHGRGTMILVVDDEDPIARSTALVLEKNGYKVLAAADGVSALALFKEHADKIKIVITDVMMPEMDGVELTRALKKIKPQVQILASTGHATEARRAELLALGVEKILHKPYDAKKLLETLHEVMKPAR
ncbi:MAG: PAS domain S-box protein [Verrucomicrobiota bacterium]